MVHSATPAWRCWPTRRLSWRGRQGYRHQNAQRDLRSFRPPLCADGAPLSVQQRANSSTPGTQQRPAIAALPEGGFAITWNGYGDPDPAGVYLRRVCGRRNSCCGGNAGQCRISKGRSATLCHRRWSNRSDAGHMGQHRPSVGLGRIRHLVSPDGSLLGGEILVNQSLLGTQWSPSVAAIGDGSYVVSWEGFSKKDDYSIYTRRISSDGQTVGGEQIMSQKVKGIRRNTDMVGDSRQLCHRLGWTGPRRQAGHLLTRHWRRDQRTSQRPACQ